MSLRASPIQFLNTSRDSDSLRKKNLQLLQHIFTAWCCSVQSLWLNANPWAAAYFAELLSHKYEHRNSEHTDCHPSTIFQPLDSRRSQSSIRKCMDLMGEAECYRCVPVGLGCFSLISSRFGEIWINKLWTLTDKQFWTLKAKGAGRWMSHKLDL